METKANPAGEVQVPPLFESTVFLGKLSQQKLCKEGITIKLVSMISIEKLVSIIRLQKFLLV